MPLWATSPCAHRLHSTSRKKFHISLEFYRLAPSFLPPTVPTFTISLTPLRANSGRNMKNTRAMPREIFSRSNFSTIYAEGKRLYCITPRLTSIVTARSGRDDKENYKIYGAFSLFLSFMFLHTLAMLLL